MTTWKIQEKANILFSIYITFYDLLLKDDHLCILSKNAQYFFKCIVLGEEKVDIGAKDSFTTLEKKKKNDHGIFMMFSNVTFMS